jgi:acyl-CoA thioester hydrolase
MGHEETTAAMPADRDGSGQSIGEGASSGRFAQGSHWMRQRVYWGDTDAGGIVYHATYLVFAERARTEMLRLAGIDQGRLQSESGIVFAVRHCAIDYLRPAKLDDCLVIRSTVVKAGGASLVIRQTILLGAAELTRLTVKVACVGKDGHVVRIPAALRDAMGATMAREGE